MAQAGIEPMQDEKNDNSYCGAYPGTDRKLAPPLVGPIPELSESIRFALVQAKDLRDFFLDFDDQFSFF